MLFLLNQNLPLYLGEMARVGRFIDTYVLFFRNIFVSFGFLLTKVHTITVVVALLTLSPQIGLPHFHLLG